MDVMAAEFKDLSKAEDTLSVQSSKKRKMEEQQSLSSSKHQFRMKQSSSEGENLLLDSYINKCSDSTGSSNAMEKFGVHLGVSNKDTAVCSSEFWKEHIEKIDGKIAGKHKTSKIDTNIVRVNEIETAMHSSCVSSRSSMNAFLDSSLSGADEMVEDCASGQPCISELTEHENVETLGRWDSPSGSSTTFEKKVRRKELEGDMECLGRSLQESFMKDDKVYTQRMPLENNQCTRLFSRAEENNAGSLLGTDETTTDSLEASGSAIKPFKGKWQQSVSTESSAWEFASESVFDEHACYLKKEDEPIELDGMSCLSESDNCADTLVCNVETPCTVNKSMEAPNKSTEIIEIINTNEAAHSQSSNLSPDNVETLPLYVLSSGRKSRLEEAQLSNERPPTIDQDFEQYFGMLML